jgi:hypothetical protein
MLGISLEFAQQALILLYVVVHKAHVKLNAPFMRGLYTPNPDLNERTRD